MDCAEGRAGSLGIAFSPRRTSLCRPAKSDVHEPIERSWRYCGVAMATYEETTRSVRAICTMCYFGKVAMDISPWESTCRAGKEPVMANQLDHAPRWQCRLGYFPGGVDRPYGQKTH